MLELPKPELKPDGGSLLSSCRHLYQPMIQYAMREDPGIKTLIDLHGEIVDQ